MFSASLFGFKVSLTGVMAFTSSGAPAQTSSDTHQHSEFWVDMQAFGVEADTEI